MFTNESRYANVETVSAKDAAGREVRAIKLRPLGQPNSTSAVVTAGDKLDRTSQRLYKDPARHWHIGDANTELETAELVRTPGRVIEIPNS